MKNILFAIVILSTFSCATDEGCEIINFNEEFLASLNEDFCFDDGSTFRITAVNDNLCPCNVACIDPGYVGFKIDVFLEGKQISGELTIDPRILPEAPVLPDNYKFEISDQIPASADICGGNVKAEDFSWRLIIRQK